MPTGEARSLRAQGAAPPRPRTRLARSARGFTYLLLLFMVAAAGAALATLGTQWQVAAQREREAELLFRAGQIRDALQRYHDATPTGQPRLPQTLDALLRDERAPQPQHHLRQHWADPFAQGTSGPPSQAFAHPDSPTEHGPGAGGDGGWQLLRDAQGGIVGLHSRSTRAALRQHGLPPGVQVHSPAQEPPRATQVRDWWFVIQPRTAPDKARP